MSSQKNIKQKDNFESGLNMQMEGMLGKALMNLPGGILQIKMENDILKKLGTLVQARKEKEQQQSKN